MRNRPRTSAQEDERNHCSAMRVLASPSARRTFSDGLRSLGTGLVLVVLWANWFEYAYHRSTQRRLAGSFRGRLGTGHRRTHILMTRGRAPKAGHDRTRAASSRFVTTKTTQALLEALAVVANAEVMLMFFAASFADSLPSAPGLFGSSTYRTSC